MTCKLVVKIFVSLVPQVANQIRVASDIASILQMTLLEMINGNSFE